MSASSAVATAKANHGTISPEMLTTFQQTLEKMGAQMTQMQAKMDGLEAKVVEGAKASPAPPAPASDGKMPGQTATEAKVAQKDAGTKDVQEAVEPVEGPEEGSEGSDGDGEDTSAERKKKLHAKLKRLQEAVTAAEKDCPIPSNTAEIASLRGQCVMALAVLKVVQSVDRPEDLVEMLESRVALLQAAAAAGVATPSLIVQTAAAMAPVSDVKEITAMVAAAVRMTPAAATKKTGWWGHGAKDAASAEEGGMTRSQFRRRGKAAAFQRKLEAAREEGRREAGKGK
jgi:hypothetical protein